MIEVVEPGMLTTVQDLGRFAYLRHGVPISGAMDPFALRIANILVGNTEDQACLEITILGPILHFQSNALIAITGADLSPTICGQPSPMWESINVRNGDVLAFGSQKTGSRAYLSVAGGLDVPSVMGSKSTYTKAGIGGVKGRPLQSKDLLSTPLPSPPQNREGYKIPRALVELPGPEKSVRVILGPQDAAFSKKGIETFLGSVFTVSPQSDRMGYRLQGPKIDHKNGPDIISDGIPMGGIQVAGDGQPIILMADRGTSGGYTKLATVISSDIGVIAQKIPGDQIKFTSINLKGAYKALMEQEEFIRQTKDFVKSPLSRRKYKITSNNKAYDLIITTPSFSWQLNQKTIQAPATGNIALSSDRSTKQIFSASADSDQH